MKKDNWQDILDLYKNAGVLPVDKDVVTHGGIWHQINNTQAQTIWTKTAEFRWAYKECYPGDKPEKILQQMSQSNMGEEKWEEIPIFDELL